MLLDKILLEQLKKMKITFRFKSPLWEDNRLAATVIFTNQLAAIIKSGVPISRALTICSQQPPSPHMKQTILQILTQLSKGDTISNAFSKAPQYFSPFYIGMLKVAETTGDLPDLLNHLASHLERELKIKRQVISSLIYPAFVLILCLGVIAIGNFVALPAITTQLTSLHVDLPIPTKILLQVIKLAHAFWFQILLILSFTLCIWQVQKRMKLPQVRSKFDQYKLHIPIIGKLFNLMLIAQFTNKLEAFLSAGYTLDKALSLIAESEENLYFSKNILTGIINNVRNGKQLSQAMTIASFFHDSIVQLVAAGEETGNLCNMIARIHNLVIEDFTRVLAACLSLLEPAVIAIMGFIVGFVLLAIFMPLYQFIGKI